MQPMRWTRWRSCWVPDLRSNLSNLRLSINGALAIFN